MNLTDRAINSQNAGKTHAIFAAIDPRTGRQIVNLNESSILPPLIRLTCTGTRWIDDHGHEWTSHTIDEQVIWRHSRGCVCHGDRPVPSDEEGR